LRREVFTSCSSTRLRVADKPILTDDRGPDDEETALTDATTDTAPADPRREVFAALVAAQDRGMAVGPSREYVAKLFGLTPEEVREVEREGLDQQWPPL
jgi:hypothetical protein